MPQPLTKPPLITVQRAEQITAIARRMICGQTRYVLEGTVEAGRRVCLQGSDGRVVVADVNASLQSRRIRPRPLFDDDHDLRLAVEPIL